MTRVLVTGAGGFVGGALCRVLAVAGFDVVAGTRNGELPASGLETRRIGDLSDKDVLADAVAGIDMVVHLAAHAHVLADIELGPLSAYRRINVSGTRLIAETALDAGIKRLVFLSSVKVNGEQTGARPFGEDDPPAPEDAYGISKWEAEQALAAVALGTAMETFILRSPLVYGPGVRANFLSLLKLCSAPLPLPFGTVTGNRRSLIYLGNLSDAIRHVLTHDGGGGTYLVSDGEDLSTAEMVRRIRHALGRSAGLFPAPQALLRAALTGVGKGAASDRLFESLAVDSSRITRDTGWRAPFSVDDGLSATASWFWGAVKH